MKRAAKHLSLRYPADHRRVSGREHYLAMTEMALRHPVGRVWKRVLAAGDGVVRNDPVLFEPPSISPTL